MTPRWPFSIIADAWSGALSPDLELCCSSGLLREALPRDVARAAYFVPSAFLLGNIAFVVFLAYQPARGPLLVLAAIYVAAVALSAVASRRWHKANPLAVSLGIYFTHLTYGLGFLLGLLRPELDH